MEIIVFFIIIATAIWVYIDAKSIGIKKGQLSGFCDMTPLSWALCVLLLWIVAFPLYLIKRPEIKAAVGGTPIIQKGIPQSTLNKVCKYITIFWTFFCVVGVISGLISIGASIDTSNEYEIAGAAIGTSFGLSLWFFAWLFIALPSLIIFIVTKKSGQIAINPEDAIHNNEKKKCPFCAEAINKEAVFCRFCKQSLPNNNIESKEKKHPHNDKGKPFPLNKPDVPIKNWPAKARQHLKKQEYKEAISAYNYAITMSPTGQLYYERAVAFSKIKDKNNMVADLNRSADFGYQKAISALGKISS